MMNVLKVEVTVVECIVYLVDICVNECNDCWHKIV